MKYVFIPRPYDNQETMHEEGSGGSHSGGSLKHRRTHPRMVNACLPNRIVFNGHSRYRLL